MLGRRHDVAANIGWLFEIADAERIGEAERLAQLPHFERRGRVHDLRTGAVFQATVEQALRAAGERVVHAAVGEREFSAGIHAVGGLGNGATGLAEAYVQRHETPAYVREGAVEHDSAALVAIEAEMDQRTYIAPALRGAHNQRL